MKLPENCYLSTLPVEHTEQRLLWLQQQGVHFPESLKRAVIKRQCEFLTGRLCAGRALEAAGYNGSADIATGAHRQPIWPAGFSGSITHTDHLAAAVVVPESAGFQGIGIDIEQRMPEETARQLQSHILLPDEAEYSREFVSFAAYSTLVFSAKEALYKAIFPQVQQILEFNSAAVTAVYADSIRLTLQYDLTSELKAGRSFDVLFEWLSGEVVQTFVVV